MVYAAMILAVARRTFRPEDAPPLAPIATLHYFRPVIDELLAEPPEPDYLSYIRYRLASVARRPPGRSASPETRRMNLIRPHRRFPPKRC